MLMAPTTDLNREKRKSWHEDAAVTAEAVDNGTPSPQGS
jgi:hypothetical protein